MPMRTTAQTPHRHMEAWKHSTHAARRGRSARAACAGAAAAVRVRAGDALGDS